MFWGKKIRIGIDLGTFGLKVCSLEVANSSCKIWGQTVLPQRQSQDEQLEPAAMQDRLKTLLKEAESRCTPWTSKIVVNVDDTSMSTGYLEIPDVSAAEFQMALQSTLARDIPHPVSQVVPFHLEVPALTSPRCKGVFYMTVPKAAILARQAPFVQLGYEVQQCEPGLKGLIRGLTRNQAKFPQECVAVVAVGFRTTTVVVLYNGHPYFSREFRTAGRDFTYAFQASEQIPWDEAEARKRESDAAEASYMVEPYLKKWEEEVRRSLNFAGKKFTLLRPTRVILAGGSSAWSGLDRRLSAHLHIPVVRQSWEKFRPSDIPATATRPEIADFNVALGLVAST